MTVDWMIGTWLCIAAVLILLSWVDTREEEEPYRSRLRWLMVAVSILWPVVLPVALLSLFGVCAWNAYEQDSRKKP